MENLPRDDDATVQDMYNIVRRLSLRTKELRHLKVKQTFALIKFMKWAGPEWRQSR